jgi:hypothetical protein
MLLCFRGGARDVKVLIFTESEMHTNFIVHSPSFGIRSDASSLSILTTRLQRTVKPSLPRQNRWIDRSFKDQPVEMIATFPCSRKPFVHQSRAKSNQEDA